MRNRGVNTNPSERCREHSRSEAVPIPTTQFRRRSWLDFQRAIDPLGPPKPLKIERH
jgi:hypothetical protein